jgi:uncharacterized protein YqjF (DUF2071 family)
MVNFAIDPAVLAPLVPRGTILDEWNGATLVSAVGFRFLDTRVIGVPIPFHRNFEEVNLRFYVRREAADGIRRGVVFVKELVPRRAIAGVARWLYNENYVALPMAHSLEGGASDDAVRAVAYRWRHQKAWSEVALTTTGAPALPANGSEEEFVTEHYWGYVRQRDGGTLEYQVEHPRWRVWRVASCRVKGDVAALYGRELGAALAGAPRSAFLAEGSPIVVRRGVRLDLAAQV